VVLAKRGSDEPNKKERAEGPLLIKTIMSSPLIYVLFLSFQAAFAPPGAVGLSAQTLLKDK
jgi:hypothetical protein